MNFFDIVFTVIIFIFFAFSFSSGSLRALLSVFGIGFGYLLADGFHERYVGTTLQYLNDYAQAKIVTYLALFAIGIIIAVLLSAVVRVMFSFQSPTLPSRILGGLLGILMGTLVCLLILFVVEEYIPSFTDDLLVSYYTPILKSIKEVISGINFAFLSSKPPV